MIKMREEGEEEEEEGRGGDARREDCAAAQIWAKGVALSSSFFLIKRGGTINVKEFTSITLQLKQGQTNRGQHKRIFEGTHWQQEVFFDMYFK